MDYQIQKIQPSKILFLIPSIILSFSENLAEILSANYLGQRNKKHNFLVLMISQTIIQATSSLNIFIQKRNSLMMEYDLQQIIKKKLSKMSNYQVEQIDKQKIIQQYGQLADVIIKKSDIIISSIIQGGFCLVFQFLALYIKSDSKTLFYSALFFVPGISVLYIFFQTLWVKCYNIKKIIQENDDKKFSDYILNNKVHYFFNNEKQIKKQDVDRKQIVVLQQKNIFYQNISRKILLFVSLLMVGGSMFLTRNQNHQIQFQSVILNFIKMKESIDVLYSCYDVYKSQDQEIKKIFDAKIKKGINVQVEKKFPLYEFKNVQHQILKNCNVKINVGNKVAIVGQNGHGKSTIMNLINKTQQLGPVKEHGKVLFFGKNIQKYNKRKYFRHVSCVDQNQALINDTVINNILIGLKKSSRNKEKAIQLCKYLQIHDKIMTLQHDYDTLVNDIKLSGGQQQMIMISRMILRKPKVILLDEYDSYLDCAKKDIVFNLIFSYHEQNKDITIISITHVDSSLKFYDQIIHVKDGQIA